MSPLQNCLMLQEANNWSHAKPPRSVRQQLVSLPLPATTQLSGLPCIHPCAHTCFHASCLVGCACCVSRSVCWVGIPGHLRATVLRWCSPSGLHSRRPRLAPPAAAGRRLPCSRFGWCAVQKGNPAQSHSRNTQPGRHRWRQDTTGGVVFVIVIVVVGGGSTSSVTGMIQLSCHSLTAAASQPCVHAASPADVAAQSHKHVRLVLRPRQGSSSGVYAWHELFAGDKHVM
jgi:hypothetical protein